MLNFIIIIGNQTVEGKVGTLRSEMSIIADQFDSLSAYSSKKPQVRRAVKVWEASFNAAAAGHRSIDNLWQWHCLVFVGLVVVLSAAAFTGWQETMEAARLNAPVITLTRQNR